MRFPRDPDLVDFTWRRFETHALVLGCHRHPAATDKDANSPKRLDNCDKLRQLFEAAETDTPGIGEDKFMQRLGLGVATFLPLNAPIRWIGKRATAFSLLALFVCFGAWASYGWPAGLRPLTVTVDSHYYPTLGNAADVAVASTGHVLVSLSANGAPPFPPDQQAGVQVFSPAASGYANPCGGQKIINFPAPSAGQSVQSVFGIKLFPYQVSVGAAVDAQGGEFSHIADLNACAIDGIVNVQQPPKASPAPGTFDLAITPDGSYAFVANEYGQVPPVNIDGSGTVGIIKIETDLYGRFTSGTKPIPVNNYIYIKGGSAVPGVTMSHDGKLLYVTSEVAMAGYENPTNSDNTILVTGNTCVQNAGPQLNGLLTIIDVEKAKRGAGQSAILRTIASGCSPVRVVETANGQNIWVAARGSNLVLAFDVGKLLYFPNYALVGYGDLNGIGTAPVGLALFHQDQLLAVANSNRFSDGTTGMTSVAILDVRDPSAVTAVRTIESQSICSFPRGVTLGPDGDTLYVANFGTLPTGTCAPAAPSTLQVIRTFVR
jgi:DNA-binding beta-propeller fold protein YncE